MATPAMGRTHESSNGHAAGELGADSETLFLFGGIALMVFGAGLILANPTVRKYLGQMGAGSLLTAALPDVEKYLRLRNM